MRMTADEIKKEYTMPSLLAEYGIRPNRAGFIRCVFHKEKTASMKVYPESVYCFGCGKSGDVFAVVQTLDGVDFKTAFKKLGGSYEEKSDRERARFRQQRKEAEETRKRREIRLKQKRSRILSSLHQNRLIKENTEPFSDLWCRAVNGFEKDYETLEEINQELRANHDG